MPDLDTLIQSLPQRQCRQEPSGKGVTRTVRVHNLVVSELGDRVGLGVGFAGVDVAFGGGGGGGGDHGGFGALGDDGETGAGGVGFGEVGDGRSDLTDGRVLHERNTYQPDCQL